MSLFLIFINKDKKGLIINGDRALKQIIRYLFDLSNVKFCLNMSIDVEVFFILGFNEVISLGS